MVAPTLIAAHADLRDPPRPAHPNYCNFFAGNALLERLAMRSLDFEPLSNH